MRLLQYSETGRFTLTKDFIGDDQIPPYAILSHTWGPSDEEVTFQDIVNGTGEIKPGYEKIRFCGEQAKQDGLLYFWIDTCCINKSNGAELSRSINSMFRWYRNAARCYVYLSDVSGYSVSGNHKCIPQLWESDFRKSKWFTRGWTLQELLGPVSIEFFSRERRRLGDKSSLIIQISEITNIPRTALEGYPLSQFSVEERLQWIQHRQTTLEEDKAYSLLGIFDVYILPIYNEGLASAHARLLDEFYKKQKCIQDLRLSDPRDDKKRIEDTKGGLLEGLYDWILENPDFQQWRKEQQSRLLWIKGDPGKGKTMLLCGVINELEKSEAKSVVLSYFFCQATDSRINYATAVLRGLIYLLVDQQRSLISHIRKKYDETGKSLFEDANAWVVLSKIFINILQDPSLDYVYLIVDALDECVVDLSKLMDLIVQTSSMSPRIKWIVSSRNWLNIERTLDTATQKLRLCLELNEKSISAAVATFIQFKVEWLATRNKYSNDTREAIQQHLMLNANGTFLWVALICQELSNISKWKALQKLTAFPPGLDALYRRMLDQIIDSEDAELCKSILAVVSAVYRPLTLDELITFVNMPNGVAGDYEVLSEIISLCGSFLTLRERTISFVHQSARDFLIEKASRDIFLPTIEDMHSKIFSRSLQAMSPILRRDIYNLRAPGISIDQFKQPDPDPLATVRYSCLYWVDHLFECDAEGIIYNNLKDNGSVHKFLRQSFLYWFEALSLMRSLPNGILMIRKLEDWVQANESPNLYAFINDAKRFALYSRSVIEQTPLQSYCSALVFAPEKSIVRTTFEKCIPPWIQKKPIVEPYWNAMLQTLEGHTSTVRSVAFSPDGKQVVSGSYDKTVRLWDTTTGLQIQPTLEGHTSTVTSVAFSPDGKQVVSGSYDDTVRLWDTATGLQIQPTLEGHTNSVTSVAFSPDGKQVVSGSDDDTVRLWDTATGLQIQPTLEGHTKSVTSVAFSPDGKQIVSGSWDKTVRLWDIATGLQIQPTLEGHTSTVYSVAFSSDGKQVVSGSDDKTVRLWDTTTGLQIQPTLEGHTYSVTSVAFSSDGKQVVSGSNDKTVRLWDIATGLQIQPTLKGHTSSVYSVAFSPDGKQVVSGSDDKTSLQ
ncbi:putative beta transducin-like protein [Botrytis cinerea BcDW1]|uniref:Putative beta transducin-like protein n=1 Tax=Botryotinia fuckeliana (strain BcDW1) TaxID=1290391 RepID=M7UBS3_BOTF1|nr:putative beta transducin-like protein [Botrytis cinerea BcDW1]